MCYYNTLFENKKTTDVRLEQCFSNCGLRHQGGSQKLSCIVNSKTAYIYIVVLFYFSFAFIQFKKNPL